MYCKNCGKELSEDAAFCPACGNRVSVVQISDKTEREKEQPPKKGKGPLVAFGAFILCACLVAMVFAVGAAFKKVDGEVKEVNGITVFVPNEFDIGADYLYAMDTNDYVLKGSQGASRAAGFSLGMQTVTIIENPPITKADIESRKEDHFGADTSTNVDGVSWRGYTYNPDQYCVVDAIAEIDGETWEITTYGFALNDKRIKAMLKSLG